MEARGEGCGANEEMNKDNGMKSHVSDGEYTEEELIRGISDDMFGVLYRRMTVRSMNEKAEFVCKRCNRHYSFGFCNHCGSRLDDVMACTSCDYDMKNDPPYCPECYEPTQKICPGCNSSLPLWDRFCRVCGKRTR